jgi:acetoin:2,6-dichlorophenolindophenol oxidoreductase subunit alpha
MGTARDDGMTGDDLTNQFRTLVAIREFEQTLERWFLQGVVRGAVHLAIGQEAVAVGARAGLADGDCVVPTYRGHHFALAWGIPYLDAFAEILGRETGTNRGRGGSKHLGDLARGVLPGNAIVGAGVPLAAGLALQARMDGTGRVAVAAFGEGALNQGVVSEVFNLAMIWRLPLVLLCENNQYSEMTPFQEMTADLELTRRARAYGIPAIPVDGMDLTAVTGAVRTAADRARAGDGPTLVIAETYRFCGHMSGDPMTYRDDQEVERWRQRDPITLARTALTERGVSPPDVDALHDSAARDVQEAASAARADAYPDPADLFIGAPSWQRPPGDHTARPGVGTQPERRPA